MKSGRSNVLHNRPIYRPNGNRQVFCMRHDLSVSPASAPPKRQLHPVAVNKDDGVVWIGGHFSPYCVGLLSACVASPRPSAFTLMTEVCLFPRQRPGARQKMPLTCMSWQSIGAM